MDPPCAISLRRLSRSKPNQQGGHDNSHYSSRAVIHRATFADERYIQRWAAATPPAMLHAHSSGTPNGYTQDDERDDRQPYGTVYSHWRLPGLCSSRIQCA